MDQIRLRTKKIAIIADNEKKWISRAGCDVKWFLQLKKPLGNVKDKNYTDLHDSHLPLSHALPSWRHNPTSS